MGIENSNGCLGCKWLEWFDGDTFMGEPPSGWGCNKRDDLDKRYDNNTFPFKRRPKCFES
jgi:hypothetical protein